MSIASATGALRAVQPQMRAAAMPKQAAAEFLKEPFELEPAGSGISRLRERFDRPLFAILARGRARAAHRLREHREPAAGARRGAASRAERARWRSARRAGAWRGSCSRRALVLAAAGAILRAGVRRLGEPRCSSRSCRRATTPVVLDLSLDWRVLAFTGGDAGGDRDGVRRGAGAARDAGRADRRAAGNTARGATAGGSAAAGRGGLIVAQVALSLVLVVAAGLFVRTFERLAAAPLGLDRDRILMVTITAPTVPAAERNPLLSPARAGRRPSVPGVAHAGGSLNPPIAGTLVGDIVVTDAGVAPRAGCGGRLAVHGRHAGRARGVTARRFARAATSTSATRTTRRR